MPTTNKPAPVATGTDPGLTNIVTGPVGPLDTAPEPVPPGPGLGVTATIPTPVPVVTAQTETVDVAAATASSFVPNTISTNTVIRYLSVSDESVAVNGQVTNINFVGTGVSVANNANALNSVVVTIGGGATYGNSNVVTLLAGFGSNTLSTTGNVTGGNLITGAQIVASGVIQSGTGLSTGGYLSVDGGTDLHNTTVTGNLSATGNVTGSYILGNGSQLTGLAATYSNSNVQAYLPTYSGNIGALTVTGNLTVTGTTSTVNTEVVNVSESVVGNIDAGNLRTAGQVTATGNITGNFFIGNGSALSSLTGANVSGTVANATYALTSNAATYATQATTADTANAVAGANVSGTVANATYATSAGSATTATTAGTANAVAGANVSGTVANATYALNSNAATYSTQATYADTANAVAGANVSGTVANATYATSAGLATTANTVTDAAQGNITSVGILTSLSVSGNITTTANVAANYVVLSGGLVGSGASPAPSISGFSTISAVGNITGGNLLTAGLISTSGNITANNLGNISTINLTGSSSNVLYGNGTFAPAAGGGAANTGNVTFNDVNIIGTGNLNLQPNGASSEYLNIFLTGSTDIHIAAGNGSSNVILGTDEQANVAVLTTGNVAIQAGNVGGKQTWSFDTAGNLTLPGNAFAVNYANGTQVSIGGANTGNITFANTTISAPNNDDINIQALDSGGVLSSEITMRPGDIYTRLRQYSGQNSQTYTTADWTTGVYTNQGGQGAIEFSGAAGIVNFINSLQGYGQQFYSVNGGPLLPSQGWSGGGGGITFYVTALPDPNPTTVTTFEYYYSFYSQIEMDYDSEDFNIEANNIDLTLSTTNNTDIDIYSSRNLNIAVNGSLDITNLSNVNGINITTDGNNTSPIWSFGADGNLTLPGNAFAVNYANGTAVSLGGSGTVTNVQGDGIVSGLSLTGNVTTTGNLTLGGTLDLSSLAGNISTTGNISGGNVLTGGGITATGNITGGNISATNLTGTTVSVTANVIGGNITTAGQVSATGNITAANLGNISSINLDGNVSNVLSGTGTWIAAGGGNASIGNLSAFGNVIYSNVTGTPTGFVNFDTGNGSMLLGTNSADQVQIVVDEIGTPKSWTFATDGSLAAPGAVSTTGNITGGNLLTGGIVSSTGNIIGGNISATNHTGTTVSVSGNITSGNILTGGVVSATGNGTFGNISTAGSGGNITGANVITATTFSATGTASNLVRRANTIAAANAVVTLDNITAQLGGSPTRLYIGAANSNMTMAGTSQTITTGSLAAASWINVPIVTGAGNAFAMSGAISSNGDTVILNVTDQGAGSGTWRVTGMIANTSSNLYSVSIERLA